jgi:hypothetical protein
VSRALAIELALRHLLGLKLSALHHAGNMAMFSFGPVKRQNGRLLSDYSLHISCPWRLQRDGVLVTGDDDWYVRKDDRGPEGGIQGSLQGERFIELGFSYDVESDGVVDPKGSLVVVSVASDGDRGCALGLTARLDLLLFPTSSWSEAWRLFGEGTPHFVIGGEYEELAGPLVGLMGTDIPQENPEE